MNKQLVLAAVAGFAFAIGTVGVPTNHAGIFATHEAQAWNPVKSVKKAAKKVGGAVKKGAKAVLNVPGEFEAGSFNNVAASLTIKRELIFTFSAVTKSGRRYVSPRVTSAASNEPQTLHFDLEGSPASGERFRAVTLTGRGAAGRVRVHSIDLLDKPASLYLPGPESGIGQIRAAGELREGVAVGPGRAVESSGLVTQGAKLRFSYVQPRPFRMEEDEQLALSVTGSAGTVASHLYPLGGSGPEKWREVNLPLNDFEGQEITLRWSMPEGARNTCAISETGLVSGTGTPRRVLLITSDTHRADHLGSAGMGVEVRTPHLDALAAAGVSFEDCFTSTNVTNPSHIALMTATHPRDTGVLTNHEPISNAAGTLAEAFRQAGFATYASISTRHLSQRTSGLGQGFDRMAQPLKQAVIDADEAIRPIIKWMDESADVPTFVWLHLFDAHTPYEPPADLAEEYYGDVDHAFDHVHPELEGAHLASHVEYPELRDLEMPLAMYPAEVTYLDRELARVLDHPLHQNAIVAFTADHGENLGHHDIYYAHSDLYPDSIHVPLILTFPGAEAGSRIETPVRQTDVGRTLLDLAGELDAPFPGRNLMVIADEGATEPRYAIAAHGINASITEDGWHYMLRLADITARPTSRNAHAFDRHSYQLYDLSNDPGALVDLAEREPARARELRAKLVSWLQSIEDRGWRGGLVTDAETLRQLEALGYTAGTQHDTGPQELFPLDCDCTWCVR